MTTSKIIKGVVGGGRYTVTAPIIKEDYGLYLQIEGVELPSTYEVDFSNSEHNGTSVTMIGNADGVLIPHQFIDTGKDIFAFLYHVGANYGRTVYKFRIPNKVRPDRTDDTPTPEEQSVIDQAINALNEAVAQTAQDVIDADASAQSASADADRAEQAKEDASTFAQRSANSAQASADYSASAQTSAGTASAAATSASQSADRAENAANSASESKSTAQTAAQTAANKASEATTAAQTATTKAGEASMSASQASASATTASTKASEASQSASTASAKATEATTAAGTATTAKNDAVAAKTAAETAQTAAEDAAESVSASAAQIATNTADISDLKEDLSAMNTATSADVGKVLKVKTVTDGKVTEWKFGDAGGITESAASLLATILNNAAYETPQGDNIQALVHKLLYGDAPVLTGITVTYNGGTVEVGTQVVGLSGLTITATYDDGTSKAVMNYSANPATVEVVGDNVITISYSENGITKTASVTIVGVEKKTIIQPTWNMYGLNPGGSANTNTARIHSDFIDLDANTIILASGYKTLGNLTNASGGGGTYWLFTNSTTGTQGQYLEGPASISLAEMKAYIESQSKKFARLIVARIDDTNIDVSEGSTAVTLTA